MGAVDEALELDAIEADEFSSISARVREFTEPKDNEDDNEVREELDMIY